MHKKRAHKKGVRQRNKRKKRHSCNNIIDGRRAFIEQVWKTRAMDINEL